MSNVKRLMAVLYHGVCEYLFKYGIHIIAWSSCLWTRRCKYSYICTYSLSLLIQLSTECVYMLLSGLHVLKLNINENFEYLRSWGWECRPYSFPYGSKVGVAGRSENWEYVETHFRDTKHGAGSYYERLWDQRQVESNKLFSYPWRTRRSFRVLGRKKYLPRNNVDGSEY